MILLNERQAHEAINTKQRYDGWRELSIRKKSYEGSLVWADKRGVENLLRSATSKYSGKRMQRYLGPRSLELEIMKNDFDKAKAEIKEQLKQLDDTMNVQASINRAIRLARMPEISANILRGLDDRGLLGNGIRVVGTNALYAFESACGIFFDQNIMATDDLDLLRDSRKSLKFIGAESIDENSIMNVLKRVDKTFEKQRQTFRAMNTKGFLVDVIRRGHKDVMKTMNVAERQDDLVSAEIDKLYWLENAPPFEDVIIDSRGFPARMVTIDPRIYAAHKFWLSTVDGRDPLKKRKDLQQAKAVAEAVKTYLPHLPYEAKQLTFLKKEVFDAAAHLFEKPHANANWGMF
jgi:hypothetical protein